MNSRAGRALVVIPTYHERESLGPLVRSLLAGPTGVDVLIVDDNSPDGTGELADGLARLDSRVAVLRRSAKQGLGPAYVAGFRWALERDYSAIVEMDADGSHLLEQLGAHQSSTRSWPIAFVWGTLIVGAVILVLSLLYRLEQRRCEYLVLASPNGSAFPRQKRRWISLTVVPPSRRPTLRPSERTANFD